MDVNDVPVPSDSVEEPNPPPEEKQQLEAELTQIEDEISLLKGTLEAKMRRSNEIKKRLGYTTFSTIRYDLVEGFHKLEDTDLYIRTSEFLGKAKEKTVSVAQDAKEKVGSTLTAIRNSDAMKSLSERVTTTYSTVKDAIVHSTYGHPPED